MRALLLLILAASSGCAYTRDRAADLADLFVLEGGLGFGLHADVKGTDFAHLGFGYADLRKASLRGRDAYNTRDREVGLPASPLLVYAAVRDGHLHRLGHLHANGLELRDGQDRWIRRFDVGAGFTAGLLMARIGFSPGEFFDFLAGLIGLDPAGDDRGRPFDDAASQKEDWIPGDTHVHIAPPDGRGHVKVDLEEARALAAAEGSQWLALTPHLWWRDGPQSRRRHPSLDGAEARASPMLIAGWEYSRNRRPGHALLLFRRPLDLDDGLPGSNDTQVQRWLTTLPDEDIFVAQAHPFGGPLRIPFVRISYADLSWKPYRGPGLDPAVARRLQDDFDGLEVFNNMIHLAETVLGLPKEERHITRAFKKLDLAVARRKKPLAPLGGSDNHRDLMPPGTWALAEPEPAAIFDALKAGRVVVGGPEAASFEGRADGRGPWRPIGSRLKAKGFLELRWRGSAELIVDGQSRGSKRGPVRLEMDPGFRYARIIQGRSYSGYIVAERSEAAR